MKRYIIIVLFMLLGMNGCDDIAFYQRVTAHPLSPKNEYAKISNNFSFDQSYESRYATVTKKFGDGEYVRNYSS
jgi:hypothetical protein